MSDSAPTSDLLADAFDLSPDGALRTAEEFLDGLINHAGVRGYMDPDAGEVSTVLVLTVVRRARALLASRSEATR